MGVYDYIDFIQNNGQNLTKLDLLDEEESEDEYDEYETETEAGSSDAIIVIVPENVDLFLLDLHEFAQYPTLSVTYKDNDFVEIDGYDHKNHGIWSHKKYPGKVLVNFEPVAYNCFVLQLAASYEVPYSYYIMILKERKIKCDSRDKDLLWSIITRGSKKEVDLKDKMDNAYFNFLDHGGCHLIGLIAQYAMSVPYRSSLLGDVTLIRWVRVHNILPISYGSELITPVSEILSELRLHWNVTCQDIMKTSIVTAPNPLYVMKELRLGFKVNDIISDKMRSEMIYKAAGDIPTLKELHQHWGCTIDHVGQNVIYDTIAFERYEVLRELCNTYKLTADHIRKADPERRSLMAAARNNRPMILKELRLIGFTQKDLNIEVIKSAALHPQCLDELKLFP